MGYFLVQHWKLADAFFVQFAHFLFNLHNAVIGFHFHSGTFTIHPTSELIFIEFINLHSAYR